MSQKGMIRFELNLCTAAIVVAILCISAMSVYGQIEHLTPANMEKVAAMPATSLLALITILSLILTGYLIRLLFGKLLAALEANTLANASLSKLLAERPCIRDPRND